jgi:hypothetical protein
VEPRPAGVGQPLFLSPLIGGLRAATARQRLACAILSNVPVPCAIRAILCCGLSSAMVVLAAPTGAGDVIQHPGAISAFQTYLGPGVHLSASDAKALLAGRPVTKLLDGDASQEVAVFGAIWIHASPSAYVERAIDIETLERGGAFRVTRRIGDPPRAEDFAALTLTDEDLSDLKHCRVGDCEVKLGERALRALQSEVDWKSPSAKAQANAVFRRMALEHAIAYGEGGNAALPVYRDKDRPRLVADEFRAVVDRIPWLATELPDLRRYLLEYPRVSLPGAIDFLYWQDAQFGLKPTIRMSHLVIQPGADRTVVASKMIYASHYFWTALELRILEPDAARGRGFWFVTINRSRSDGLSGFLGRFVRGRVRSEVQKGTLTALTATKTKLEGTR